MAIWKKSYDEPRQHIKKQRHHFANKGLYSQSYDFFSSHVWLQNLVIMKAEHQRTVAFKTVLPLGQQGDQTSQS